MQGESFLIPPLTGNVLGVSLGFLQHFAFICCHTEAGTCVITLLGLVSTIGIALWGPLSSPDCERDHSNSSSLFTLRERSGCCWYFKGFFTDTTAKGQERLQMVELTIGSLSTLMSLTAGYSAGNSKQEDGVVFRQHTWVTFHTSTNISTATETSILYYVTIAVQFRLFNAVAHLWNAGYGIRASYQRGN